MSLNSAPTRIWAEPYNDPENRVSLFLQKKAAKSQRGARRLAGASTARRHASKQQCRATGYGEHRSAPAEGEIDCLALLSILPCLLIHD